MKNEETACGFANTFTFKWAVNCPPLTAHRPLFPILYLLTLSAISYNR
jgi:hypothetical protein